MHGFLISLKFNAVIYCSLDARELLAFGSRPLFELFYFFVVFVQFRKPRTVKWKLETHLNKRDVPSTTECTISSTDTNTTPASSSTKYVLLPIIALVGAVTIGVNWFGVRPEYSAGPELYLYCLGDTIEDWCVHNCGVGHMHLAIIRPRWSMARTIDLGGIAGARFIDDNIIIYKPCLYPWHAVNVVVSCGTYVSR